MTSMSSSIVFSGTETLNLELFGMKNFIVVWGEFRTIQSPLPLLASRETVYRLNRRKKVLVIIRYSNSVYNPVNVDKNKGVTLQTDR